MATSDVLRRFWLDGQVAAITGAAHGIGREAAEVFAAVGAQVVILDVDEAAARQAAESIGGDAVARRLDVTSEREVGEAIDAIVREHGRLDVFVNNAGMTIRQPTIELSLADWQRVVDVNLTGTFLCARAAGRVMLPRSSGAIVNVASIMGLSGGGLYPNVSYASTKGAIVNMTRALAVEWARSGVRVNAVAPTWVDTRFIAALKAAPELMAAIERMTPMGRIAQPREVADAILFLASPAASMITGHILAVDGGYLAQ